MVTMKNVSLMCVIVRIGQGPGDPLSGLLDQFIQVEKALLDAEWPSLADNTAKLVNTMVAAHAKG